MESEQVEGNPDANYANDGFHIAVPDTVVPEPSTGLLLAAGSIGLAGVRRNRAWKFHVLHAQDSSRIPSGPRKEICVPAIPLTLYF